MACKKRKNPQKISAVRSGGGYWIWLDNEISPDSNGEFFEEIEISHSVSVRLRISCDSNYAVYINDALAAFGQYADYPWYKVYDEIELSTFFTVGVNCIKIIVWYYGENFSTYYKGKPGVWYEWEIGDKTVCVSSRRTLCCKSENYLNGLQKIITPQLGYSFCYDTCVYSPPLAKAVEIPPLARELYLRPINRCVLGERSEGILIDEAKHMYDLGRERAGLLFIRFEAEKEAKLKISYGEHITDGCVRSEINGRSFSVELIGCGKIVEYMNPFRRLGGRFLQVECDEPFKIDAIGLQEIEYPVTEIPFVVGDSLQQKIYDVSVRTLKLCMHEHYEDTPWREQALYCFDARNQMLCGYSAFCEFTFPKANLNLIAQACRKDKLLPICFPSSIDLTIPSFSLHYIIAVEEYLRFSGDVDFVKTIYPRLCEIVDVFTDRLEGGLTPIFYGDKGYWNFYDWAEGLEGKLYEVDEKSFDLILNALLVFALLRLRAIAIKLKENTSKVDKLIPLINEAIRNVFYDEKTGLFSTFAGEMHFSETGNALAILCGAAGESSGAVAKKIAASELLPASLSMKCFSYDALLQTDFALYRQYIMDDIDSRCGRMLERNAASFWETEDGERAFDGAGSLCHGWSAMPIYYYRLLCGQPTPSDMVL